MSKFLLSRLEFFSTTAALAIAVLFSFPAVAQDAVAQDQATDSGKPPEAKPAEPPRYQPAIKLLPDTAAGLVRVPDVPAFCTAFDKTGVGRLLDDLAMQPFLQAQRERAKDYLESVGNKIGIRLEDLYQVASGEAVLAWLSFDSDARRPYALVAVADVRQRQNVSKQTIETIDDDLTASGWTRNDKVHRGETLRVYSTTPKPGQLKIERIVVCLNDVRLIASDRESVVTDLLDAAAGDPRGASISQLEMFKTVLARSARKIRGPAQQDGGTLAVEWFAKPFQMARIIRKSINVDRGNQLDILKLLEDQGFNAIQAAGGVAVMAGNQYDLIHKGYVLAPPTTDQPSKYELAARMLQFDNQPFADIPSWIDSNIATLTRVNLKMEPAFWAAETLVNDALDDELFREVIDGIRDDEDGPRIDIAGNVLPNLDDHLLWMTYNTQPVDVDSERMLVAIRVKDGDVIGNSIRKAMQAEPDAGRMPGPEGVEIWRVQKNDVEDDFGSDLFDDFDEPNQDAAGPAPLLENWAIALVPKGPGSDAPYLMFSSDPEMLVETATRIVQNAPPGLTKVPAATRVLDSMNQLGGDSVAIDRIARMKLSIRAKYQLLRQGKLRDSDSLAATLMRRLVESDSDGQADPLSAKKLPPIQQIQQYLPDGGGFTQTTDDGWALTGFFLKATDPPN